MVAWDLTRLGERSRYRPASILLELSSALALLGVFLGIPGWLCVLTAVPLSIILAIMTYHRLRDGGFSSAWVWLMVVPLGIGPTWHLSEHLTFNFGGYLVGFVPVIMAWMAPTNTRRGPKSETA